MCLAAADDLDARRYGEQGQALVQQPLKLRRKRGLAYVWMGEASLADADASELAAYVIYKKKVGRFIIDPDGVLQAMENLSAPVGRSVDEVLRVLDALQTDELCPCNWKKGERTLEAA